MCGPASLKAVLAYYGVNKTEAELAQLSGANPEDGTRPEGLARAAKALGFQAEVRDNVSFDDLKGWLAKGAPVIVDWWSTDEGHYSVVTAIRDGHVYMKDPELGTERALPMAEFERVWFDFEQPSRLHKGLSHRQVILVTR
jgi:predicted double-glycine peptidase